MRCHTAAATRVALAAAAGLVALAVAATIAPAAVVGFSDGTFNDTDWTTVTIQDTTPGSAATGASGQSVSDGSPAPYRHTTHSWDTTHSGVSIFFAHLAPAFIYAPAVHGPVTSLDYSFDYKAFSAPYVGAVGVNLVILQDGNYYTRPSYAAVPGNPWTHAAHTSLIASDFTLFGGTGNPDFSASGAPLTFGYFTGNGGSGIAAHLVATAGIDNFAVALNTVPEPSALAIAAGLVPALVRRRRWTSVASHLGSVSRSAGG